ncbi:MULTISPECIES: transketolase C-terminal domain-containing protein [unclassified Fusibacter]|uniref:transketolase C-terminal domain-containing protein n=1 Tax=unclassified Fusibacter TaxID=2624464 RepID=UPI00101104C3|nr:MULTISPECIES: transketolase C-terminal domain-containing protein [unclassified Fusibacter]MCK8058735.1 pyruvate ferredoxin oxidoreductase [Fusibacter sp. A2]NPE21809.1 pyruvate ferredoxin oxidoreductase [Fusibacter sp. A1]RXV61381.1 pyruvate ferredoxin oxidoreductase [Fusibacter sp. A1]
MNDKFLNGNEAVAYGVLLAKPHVVAAYPITPQTKAVEKISQFVQDGDLDCEYMHVESEHSAMACSIGASSVGARTFTATSSQGLLYMLECLPYASGARLPIVMMNANRAIATPWNIYGDQMDIMYALNSGWVQLFVEDAQEALDVTLQAFKLAEHKDVLAPVVVNLDGFVLTHTYEKVSIPASSEVDAFLPPIAKYDHIMSDEHPMSMCISAGNHQNQGFKQLQHEALFNAEGVFETIEREFSTQFGRAYGGAVDSYRMDDAEIAMLTTGSVTGTARVVVDELRREGIKAGLIKLRMVRPFPTKRLLEVVADLKGLVVFDKNVSFGYEGTIFTNVNSALMQSGKMLKVENVIGGLGGRDIPHHEIKSAYMNLIDKKNSKQVRFSDEEVTA